MVDSSSPGAELVCKLGDEGGELGGRGEGRQVGHHGLLLLQAHHHLLHTNQLGGLEWDTLLVHITYNNKHNAPPPLTLVVMKLTHLPQVIPSTCTLATPRLPPGPGRAMAGLSTEAENLAGLQLVIWSAT